jgi:hypothetical protein
LLLRAGGFFCQRAAEGRRQRRKTGQKRKPIPTSVSALPRYRAIFLVRRRVSG